MLGADEFGFATAPLVVTGCIMMRKCHLNTCPVGVATQDPVLRRKFSGQPEHVVNFFFFVAEEVREIMAQLGFRTIDEMIGRADLLDMRAGIEHWKARGLDFSRVFHQPQMPRRRRALAEGIAGSRPRARARPRARQGAEAGHREEAGGQADAQDPQCQSLGGRDALRRGRAAYGHEGLPDDTIHVTFDGIAGQSFGAFLARGITFELQGSANDYVGKGMSGGRIVVYPDPTCPAKPEENIVIGNTVMYGAIEGESYFRGVAGERFCVRNSGAAAVVEGTGDHGCEYMTGGTVVVLGKTGRNFAAGMSGGIAYVYDADGTFAQRCNTSMVALETVLTETQQAAAEKELAVAGKSRLRHLDRADEAVVRELVEKHLRYTGSTLALALLDDWEAARGKFVKVFPHEYRRALTEMHVARAAQKPGTARQRAAA